MQLKSLRFFVILFVFSLLTFFSTSKAQFVNGGNYFGPSIGLSFLGSSPEFGVNYEYGLNLENVGTVGIGGIFRYWSYSESYNYGFYGSGEWKYTNILIGAQGNYHFKVPDSKFDPYLGIILAYDAGSTSWSGPNIYGASVSAGGFWAALQAGGRYWLTPTLALTARLGFGSLSYGGLDVGVDFKF
jgi:hypothetical protein